MKIRIIKNTPGIGFCYMSGDVVDVPDKIAKVIMEKRCGVPADEAETAQSKQAEKREKSVSKGEKK